MSEIRTDTINNASGDNDSGLDLSTNDQVIIKTANTTAVTVDASQNVGIGESSPDELLHLKSNSSAYKMLKLEADTSGGDAGILLQGENGNQFEIHQPYDSAGLFFYDRTNTSERMRIDSSGNLLLGKTARGFSSDGVELREGSDGNDSHFTVSGGTVCSFNRNTNDGSVINIGQGGTVEGQITVSGTTVSYNGGHLSRWSRLLDNSKDTTIVKGTVMTNLDEMVEWDDEDNEQLNKMAVSSVEGDANIAGVFVNWDDDDDFNDMNIAMTGDMVIRIAQGTTVARGDLLMSAGDGTAKPQGDDIVRSKTIAKVTSTNVSHTYDDGTYLVPCVLMAC